MKIPLSVNKSDIIIDITDDSTIIRIQKINADNAITVSKTFFSEIVNLSRAQQQIVYTNKKAFTEKSMIYVICSVRLSLFVSIKIGIIPKQLIITLTYGALFLFFFANIVGSNLSCASPSEI